MTAAVCRAVLPVFEKYALSLMSEWERRKLTTVDIQVLLVTPVAAGLPMVDVPSVTTALFPHVHCCPCVCFCVRDRTTSCGTRCRRSARSALAQT